MSPPCECPRNNPALDLRMYVQLYRPIIVSYGRIYRSIAHLTELAELKRGSPKEINSLKAARGSERPLLRPYSILCISAHQATHLLHSALSIGTSSALSQYISRSLKSFLKVSVQFFRGLPLLFLPSGISWNTW